MRDSAIPGDKIMLDALLKGPAAYAPRTGWPAWAVIPAAGLIIVLALVVTFLAALSYQMLASAPIQLATQSGIVTALVMAAWQILTIALTLLAAGFFSSDREEALALRPPAQGWRALPIALVPLFLVTMTWTSVLVRLKPEAVLHDLRPFQELLHGDAFWLMLFVIGVGAPVSEELLFRGFMFSGLAKSRLGFVGAGILTSLLWTCLHLSYSVFGLIEVLAIGLYFSWLLVRTGSLWVTMFCHAVYNTVMALGLYFMTLPAAG
jgi:membrane protease YdiL (CAAX protease family)